MSFNIVVPAIITVFGIFLGFMIYFPVSNSIITLPYWNTDAPAEDKKHLMDAKAQLMALPIVMIAATWIVAFLRAGKSDVNYQ